MANAVRQAAAVPVADGRVCLVTSRTGRRWVLPKGRIERGQTPAEAARAEAWEEAGLVGVPEPEPVGRYVYRKFDRDHAVTVFVLPVTAVRDDYPEAGLRRREWVTPAEAAARVDEPELQDLLRRLFPAPAAVA